MANRLVPQVVSMLFLAGLGLPLFVTSATGIETEPTVLTGRLVDEESRAITDRELDVRIAPDAEARIHTDENGRFRLPLRLGNVWEHERSIEIRERFERDSIAYYDFAFFENQLRRGHGFLPWPLPAGLFDLGTIMLAEPGSNKPLLALDDDALEAFYDLEARDSNVLGLSHLAETCLLEMARRGGDRWVEFLRSEFERVRSMGEGTKGPSEALDVEYLTVLRRAERKPAPLALEIASGATLDSKIGDPLILECTLRNVGERAGTLEFSNCLRFRAPRFGRVNVEAIDERGRRRPLIRPPWWGVGHGELCLLSELAPGEAHPFTIDLTSFVSPPEPGTYRVRVHYHGHSAIDRYATEQGWIVTSSPFFTVNFVDR